MTDTSVFEQLGKMQVMQQFAQQMSTVNAHQQTQLPPLQYAPPPQYPQT